MPLEFLYNPILKATTALGVPVPLAKAFFYAAGSSSTLQNTYADSGQVSANANPVVADANGLFPDIFLLPLAYHLVIKDTTETITYYDQDNLAGPNYNALFDDSWQLKDNLDPTKILRMQLSGIATATIRTVTLPDADGTMLLSTIAAMASKPFQEAVGAAVTAANDMTLTADGNCWQINGATQINRIAQGSWQNGVMITLLFASTPTLTHATASGGGYLGLLLNGAVSMVAAVNNTLTLRLMNSLWIEIGRKV